MAGKSTIARLPEPVRVEVDAAIKRGATIDQIVGMLQGLGQDISRSAVGRYSKRYAELAARQRDLMSVSQAFASEFGQADDRQGRLLIQLATSLATGVLLPMASDDEVKMDARELHFFARAIKDITSAAKTDVDREAKIRAEEAKRTREQAAADAESEGRAAGASQATIDRIKARILGLDVNQGGKV